MLSTVSQVSDWQPTKNVVSLGITKAKENKMEISKEELDFLLVESREKGFDAGFFDGHSNGFDKGYARGYKDGYENTPFNATKRKSVK